MPLTARQRLRQARTKFRLVAAREWREFERGERDHLPGMLEQRIVLDAIERAYQAGLKDGRAQALVAAKGDQR